MLAALLTSLAIAKRAPAWRGLQAVSPELQAEKEHGRLRGAPPCVRTLYKEGQGNEATWRLGSLRYLGPTVPDGTPHHPDLQVSLRVPQATASGRAFATVVRRSTCAFALLGYSARALL